MSQGNMEYSSSSGGSKRGREGRALPGPDSFNFMQFLGKFGQIVYWRPSGGLAEILDPPLSSNICFLVCTVFM